MSMIRLFKFPRWHAPAFNPRAKIKPLSARLLAVSNALWQRPDSVRRVTSMARSLDHSKQQGNFHA